MSDSFSPPPKVPPLLADRVAVITGAAQGIGRGCARVFGAAGAGIALIDIDRDAAGAALNELRAYMV